MNLKFLVCLLAFAALILSAPMIDEQRPGLSLSIMSMKPTTVSSPVTALLEEVGEFGPRSRPRQASSGPIELGEVTKAHPGWIVVFEIMGMVVVGGIVLVLAMNWRSAHRARRGGLVGREARAGRGELV